MTSNSVSGHGGGQVEVVQSSEREVRGAAGDLAMAFDQYPLYQWLIEHARHSEATRMDFFMFLVRQIGLRFGRVCRLRSGGAAAIWISSESLPHFGVIGGVWTLARLDRMVGLGPARKLYLTHKAMNGSHLRGPHDYLFMMGVVPEMRNRGIGSQLLRDGMAGADHDGRPIFLETCDESNVGFYRRLGFHVESTYRICAGSPLTWAMVRPPRAVA